MWGPANQKDATGEGNFDSYLKMSSHEESERHDNVLGQASDEQVDEEQGQEAMLPVVTSYGMVNRYKTQLQNKVRKTKREESESTMFATSELDEFFRTAGTVDIKDMKKTNSAKPISMVENIIRQEFPIHNNDQMPGPQDLIKIGEREKNTGRYAPGDWVEVEGRDMIWRLDMITRALKQAPDDWDWNDPNNQDQEPKYTFTYNAGNERRIKEEDLRSSEAGLKYIFGCRPWVWQQWAILKVEQNLRFQEGHQNDFEIQDIQKLAADLWDQWLEHPSNTEFYQLYWDKRIGAKGRKELRNHIQKPFQLIDKMGEENDEWSFDQDDNVNVFTYFSLHGSGVLIPFFCLAVQIAIPILLILETQAAPDVCANFDIMEEGVYLSKWMALVIFTYYSFTVVPDTYYNFFEVVGSADSVYSRILSLRRMAWNQGDDSLLQMIGFKTDIYMNTVYQSGLMMLNIFVILNTNEVIEIVLNSLAFIFIARIDEDVAKAGWYDTNKRWLTAGTMQAGLQGSIRLRVLSSPKKFSQHYNIHEELLLQICDGDPNLFCNKGLALIDANDPSYMTKNEQINRMCAQVAKDSGNKYAVDEYSKVARYFGSIEKTLGYLFGRSYARPIFAKFTAWRTWSRWDKVLFLSPVPVIEDVFSDDFLGLSPPFENFYRDDSKSNVAKFVGHFLHVLFFGDVWNNLRHLCEFQYADKLLFRVIDVFLNWLCYFLHILFPLYLLGAFVDVLYNIITRKCLNSFMFVFSLVFGLE